MEAGMNRKRIVIMGAAGRDFHNFNVAYRNDPDVEVMAFTATQIPGIANRRYPASIAGPLYPEGIPILPEDELEAIVEVAACGVCRTDLHYVHGVPTVKPKPLVLGHEISGVVREVGEVAAQGLTEIVLLGQTVNSYHDGTHDFADLLRATGVVPGIRRVRYTSPHPNDFSDRVIAALAETPAVCEHVHLPMQSGSSRTLKRMLRRYTRDEYFACAGKLRAAIPGLGLTTDLIVGFPGETDADFEETLSAVRAIGFDDAFMFKFSMREGTPATRLPADLRVSNAVVDARFERLKDTVRGIARERNLKRLGERREVLVEKEARKGGDLLQARSRDFKTVIIPGDAAMIGKYFTVELTGTTGSTFTGALVQERRPLPVAG